LRSKPFRLRAFNPVALSRSTPSREKTSRSTPQRRGRGGAGFGPQPPGATSFFIGDELGGTGWEVSQPDGSTEKYYIDLPEEIGTNCGR